MSARMQIVCTCAVLALAWVSLYLWRYMPIYSDEIAMRFQLGRYFADKGVVTGLYALCTSNVKATPFLFTLPAQLVAFADLHLSLAQARIFPMLTILGIVLCTLRYALRGRNPWAALLVASAFIGVAGSSLVMARYELFFEINLLACLAALCLLDAVTQSRALRYLAAALVLLSALLSAYAHIQGLLLLPLSAFLMFRLLDGGRYRWGIGAVVALLFAAIVMTTLSFQRASCVEYPQIEAFWQAMTVSPAKLAMLDPWAWLAGSFRQYAQAFIYKPAYQADYLFGLAAGDAAHEGMKQIFNQAISIMLLVNMCAVVVIAVVVPWQLLRKMVSARRKATLIGWKDAEPGIFAFLLAMPIVFLFLYDSAHNFYRSIFLNLLIAVLVALHVAKVAPTRLRVLVQVYALGCVVLVAASLAGNVRWFSEKLDTPPGYEGPSLSRHRDWKAIERDIGALAQACHMDLSRGGIVMDDMSYNAVKRYPRLYPITYLSLQSGLARQAPDAIIARIHANFVIARCGAMDATKIGTPYQQRQGELCCFNYADEDASNAR